MQIEDLKVGQTASVVKIRETGTHAPEALRLREMGFDEGVEIEVLHRGLIGGCPIALRVGSNVIALRKSAAGLLDISLTTPTIQAEAAE